MLKLTPPWVSLEVESRRLSWADLKYEKRLEVVPPGVHPIMIIDKASDRIWICVVMRARYQGWNTCVITDRDGTVITDVAATGVAMAVRWDLWRRKLRWWR